MKTTTPIYLLAVCFICFLPLMAKSQGHKRTADRLSLTKTVLLDKIKGGWAGQTIGVTYGWPTEFVYQGTFIQDYEPILWEDDYINRAMLEFPGLYDDIYVDLTFLEVLERLGMDAPIDSFSHAFSTKQYDLWHANQVARYNLKNGISPLSSGHWLNNPHADDIDFQIESDFAGLISPAMPQAASSICEKTGKMIASGDGYYGGVFVANMYALAFCYSDIKSVINNALNAIPRESKFYRCIRDVLECYKKERKDWKTTWWTVQRKWAEDTGCPNGVFHPLNIDAKLNAAYVVMALLYGEGDFFRTMDIATRAGQDSDCNPATACGILGTIIGYNSIPQKWLGPLKRAEDKIFSFSSYALKDIYRVNYDLALANIEKNGGSIRNEQVIIPLQHTSVETFEENFSGHYPVSRTKVGKQYPDNYVFGFEGNGVVISGHLVKVNPNAGDEPVQAELYVDGVFVEKANLYTGAIDRRPELFWKYQLTDKNHRVEIKLLAPSREFQLYITDYLVYQSNRRVPETK
ncbi:ADP-ribosylglycohydrolase family protein [Olivibacter jilunii]|uniref:ADP-ribosylglycohydrolase family protein n=1 Tax=Olivibacter jilunii TaxID=985016 RepID=UPI003F1622B1